MGLVGHVLVRRLDDGQKSPIEVNVGRRMLSMGCWNVLGWHCCTQLVHSADYLVVGNDDAQLRPADFMAGEARNEFPFPSAVTQGTDDIGTSTAVAAQTRRAVRAESTDRMSLDSWH